MPAVPLTAAAPGRRYAAARDALDLVRGGADPDPTATPSPW
ncbi:hypothetical protein [Thermomonospora umbrina]|uniref:Uncharacterized protein n=1 Tax=Thermomonospora umbrina TaxID=111806 RepID=A0A3D9ST39_9ACTN|nr:hypothetical protein [Thermomonospora umbrina]REE97650.1 hypothetical protein DFJ69_3124 [Thermomonospora umbrina]